MLHCRCLHWAKSSRWLESLCWIRMLLVPQWPLCYQSFRSCLYMPRVGVSSCLLRLVWFFLIFSCQFEVSSHFVPLLLVGWEQYENHTCCNNASFQLCQLGAVLHISYSSILLHYHFSPAWLCCKVYICELNIIIYVPVLFVNQHCFTSPESFVWHVPAVDPADLFDGATRHMRDLGDIDILTIIKSLCASVSNIMNLTMYLGWGSAGFWRSYFWMWLFRWLQWSCALGQVEHVITLHTVAKTCKWWFISHRPQWCFC